MVINTNYHYIPPKTVLQNTKTLNASASKVKLVSVSGKAVLELLLNYGMLFLGGFA